MNRNKTTGPKGLNINNKTMNKLLDLAALTAATVFTTGATIFFAKASVENTKSIGKAFMSILKK